MCMDMGIYSTTNKLISFAVTSFGIFQFYKLINPYNNQIFYLITHFTRGKRDDREVISAKLIRSSSLFSHSPGKSTNYHIPSYRPENATAFLIQPAATARDAYFADEIGRA